MIVLDGTDHRILTALQGDGRMANSELAERIHLSESACLRRVRRLEADGVIAGYVMLVDQATIGRPDNVFVEDYLRQSYERKVDYLRSATALVALADE